MPKTDPPVGVQKPISKILVGTKAAARITDSGAAKVRHDLGGDLYMEKLAQTQALVAPMPFSTAKSTEHGFANAISP